MLRCARVGRAAVCVLLLAAGAARRVPGIVRPVDVRDQGGRRPVVDQQRHRKDDEAEQSEKAHRAAFNHRQQPKRRGI